MFSSQKPYTAITVTIERLTSESYSENDLSGLPNLVEVVNLQVTGPTEAARAIRKKLKYGNLHRQLRALTLLDGLIQNAGPRFQSIFADEPLLERLRFCGMAQLSDPLVKKKCAELFRGWATEYKDVRGMERVVNLYQELPRRKHVVTPAQSKVVKETENPFGDDEDEHPTTGSSSQPPSASQAPPKAGQPQGLGISSSKEKDKKKKEKDKKSKKQRRFNLEAEKEQMKASIAEASIAATNLMNTLQGINREQERISENQAALKLFDECKQLRRRILRYIYHVEHEQWLGSLLHANDELVTALMTFEQLDRSIDADSDSDDDAAAQAHMHRMASEKAKDKEMASPPTLSSPVPPPRPSAMTKPSMSLPPAASIAGRAGTTQTSDDDDEDDEDEDDPFADRNAVGTPKMESSEPKWS